MKKILKNSLISLVLLNSMLNTSIALGGVRNSIDTTDAQEKQLVGAVKEKSLFDQMAVLDVEVFDSFNHCDKAEQLAKHTQFFDPKVEFYHDNGDVTWTRQAMIANTKKNACGNYRRELVAGSLQVYPIKGFGAIAQGSHRFCTVKTGKCEGLADFVMVWQKKGSQWTITRVLSYGHRENQQ